MATVEGAPVSLRAVRTDICNKIPREIPQQRAETGLLVPGRPVMTPTRQRDWRVLPSLVVCPVARQASQ